MLILASASPRRHELLNQIHITHRCVATSVDESRKDNELCNDYVQRIAHKKASALFEANDETPILAADTIVCLDDEMFGKPQTIDQARHFLKRLSGKTHRVLTAVVLKVNQSLQTKTSISKVELKNLSFREIEWWLSFDEFSDKAGAYAIQGPSGAFVESIEGSYSGVVGLPLFETTELLTQANLWPPSE